MMVTRGIFTSETRDDPRALPAECLASELLEISLRLLYDP